MIVIGPPFFVEPELVPDALLSDEPPDPPELLEPQAPRASVPVRTRASGTVRCMVLLWWFGGSRIFLLGAGEGRPGAGRPTSGARGVLGPTVRPTPGGPRPIRCPPAPTGAERSGH